MLTCILQPYSRVNTENTYPIQDLFPDLLMLTGLCKVVVLPTVSIFKCHLQGNFLRLNSLSNSLISRKIIPYSRPKISDFYTLIESKLAEYHTLHSSTYLCSSYMGGQPLLFWGKIEVRMAPRKSVSGLLSLSCQPTIHQKITNKVTA